MTECFKNFQPFSINFRKSHHFTVSINFVDLRMQRPSRSGCYLAQFLCFGLYLKRLFRNRVLFEEKILEPGKKTSFRRHLGGRGYLDLSSNWDVPFSVNSGGF